MYADSLDMFVRSVRLEITTLEIGIVPTVDNIRGFVHAAGFAAARRCLRFLVFCYVSSRYIELTVSIADVKM